MSIRIYDIPHYESRLVTFQALSTAPLNAGFYNFPGTWESLIIPTFLKRGVYIVRQAQFSADVAESDWQGAWVNPPMITWGVTSQALGPLFRQPLVLLKYTEGVEFIECVSVDQEPSELKFKLSGRLQQSGSMIGKASLRASVTLFAYEITNDAWVRKFKEEYKE